MQLWFGLLVGGFHQVIFFLGTCNVLLFTSFQSLWSYLHFSILADSCLWIWDYISIFIQSYLLVLHYRLKKKKQSIRSQCRYRNVGYRTLTHHRGHWLPETRKKSAGLETWHSQTVRWLILIVKFRSQTHTSGMLRKQCNQRGIASTGAQHPFLIISFSFSISSKSRSTSSAVIDFVPVLMDTNAAS